MFFELPVMVQSSIFFARKISRFEEHTLYESDRKKIVHVNPNMKMIFACLITEIKLFYSEKDVFVIKHSKIIFV